jgi:hypothetical protein
MKKLCLPLLLLLVYVSSHGQRLVAQGANVTQGKLIRVSDPFHPDPKFRAVVVRNEEGVIGKEEQAEFRPSALYPLLQHQSDGALQSSDGNVAPDTYSAIEGLGYSRVCPADPTMAVGPNHLIQMVNDRSGTNVQVWDKAGNVVMGKKLLSDITGIQGYGDCIALYDQLADRFILTEIQFGSSFGLIMAISATSNPLGAWYTYLFPNMNLTDYPKYAVWNNAYYAKTNDFRLQGGTFKYVGETVYAFDRNSLLNGASTVNVQNVSLPPTNAYFSMCPVGLAGANLPPSGTGGLFAFMNDNTWTKSDTDSVGVLEYRVDFTTPANSRLLEKSFAVAAFDPDIPNIAQPRYQRLDALAYRVMNQPVYRKLSQSEALALAFTVKVNKAAPTAAVRWLELKRTGADWSVNQQSTFSPDALNRWIPSISIDAEGGIGLAYNVAGTTRAPSIRFTGRRSGDPLNTMTIEETSIQEGISGSNCYGRYGDYNHLVIDPADNSTYWFTAMYNTATYWSTKIGSFSFTGGTPTVSRQRVNAEEQKMERAFGVYPNPAHDRLTVTFPLTAAKPVLQVLDMNGKLMASYKISGSQHVVNTAGLAQGIYLLKMSAGNVVRYVKFVKE